MNPFFSLIISPPLAYNVSHSNTSFRHLRITVRPNAVIVAVLVPIFQYDCEQKYPVYHAMIFRAVLSPGFRSLPPMRPSLGYQTTQDVITKAITHSSSRSFYSDSDPRFHGIFLLLFFWICYPSASPAVVSFL
ncbi:hypothetical protein Hypma_004328 [Hypsizygus marmoreus]|uniref:Uncharacterized protein n=1 Tax=Hypsizygus marmoreus TaxID=39966 RepID=A0A369K937_HYPMA|nr:hypothetical protein Hypma_004328 [Hypsizygus marmoreus]